jgi:NADH:ubiquinone oxidoreductase subunit E
LDAAKTHLNPSSLSEFNVLLKHATAEKALTQEVAEKLVEWSLHQHKEEKNQILTFLHNLQEHNLLTKDAVEHAVNTVYERNDNKFGKNITKDEALTYTVLDLERVIV